MVTGLFALMAFIPHNKGFNTESETLVTDNDSLDLSQCGMEIDGVIADSIPCWTFDHMNLVVPMTDKYKKYDKIVIRLGMGMDNGRYGDDEDFAFPFTKESFEDNFGGAKYVVVKLLADKKTDKIEGDYDPNTTGGYKYYDREKLAYDFYTGNGVHGAYMQLTFYGKTITGYNKDVYGNNTTPIYSAPTYFYIGKMVPIVRKKPKGFKSMLLTYTSTKTNFDIDAPCQNIPGKKFDLKIENVPTAPGFGIIK